MKIWLILLFLSILVNFTLKQKTGYHCAPFLVTSHKLSIYIFTPDLNQRSGLWSVTTTLADFGSRYVSFNREAAVEGLIKRLIVLLF